MFMLGVSLGNSLKSLLYWWMVGGLVYFSILSPVSFQ